ASARSASKSSETIVDGRSLNSAIAKRRRSEGATGGMLLAATSALPDLDTGVDPAHHPGSYEIEGEVYGCDQRHAFDRLAGLVERCGADGDNVGIADGNRER